MRNGVKLAGKLEDRPITDRIAGLSFEARSAAALVLSGLPLSGMHVDGLADGTSRRSGWKL